MLQRIQTIWLFLASTVLFALFLFPTVQWLGVDGKAHAAKVTGVYESLQQQVVQTEGFTVLSIVCVLLAVFPFVVIFFYNNRPLQIKLCYGGIVAVLGFSFWLAKTIQHAADKASFSADNYGIGAMLPSVAVLLFILAIRAIRKDENLIRSADRLR